MSRTRRAERRESAPEAVAARRLRAAEESLDVRVRSTVPFLDLEVRNPAHRSSYRVVLPEYPLREGGLCTCTDFARRGLGTCKHLEAAWAWLRTHPPSVASGAPPNLLDEATLWRELDARRAAFRADPPTTIRALERAGAPLFEESSPSPRTGKGDGEEVRRAESERTGPTTTSRARP